MFRLNSETIASTAHTTNLLTRSFDSLGRSTGLALDDDYSFSYEFDTYGRMNAVTGLVGVASALRADYSYLASTDPFGVIVQGDSVGQK